MLKAVFSSVSVNLGKTSMVRSLTDARKPPFGRIPGIDLRAGQEFGQADQVVGGGGEGEHPADPGDTAMAGLAQARRALDPAEHLLDALAKAQADRVAGSPSPTSLPQRPFVMAGVPRGQGHLPSAKR